MTSTTYYNLNIVEGTDIVNPLTVDNPNYEAIDEAMHANAVAGTTIATEVANASVHALTRENPDCAVIRFIATSDWNNGDSFTVDGVPVSATLPSGRTLPDRAYVVNANVLAILTGSNLTVYVSDDKTYTATDIPYENTTVAAELDAIGEELVDIDTRLEAVEARPASSYKVKSVNVYAAIAANNVHIEEVQVTDEYTNYANVIAVPYGTSSVGKMGLPVLTTRTDNIVKIHLWNPSAAEIPATIRQGYRLYFF